MIHRHTESAEFDEQVRRALVEGGFLTSIRAPHEVVESVLAQLYENRLSTFRARRPDVSTAQLLAVIIARSQEARRDSAWRIERLRLDAASKDVR